jgi:hypothetical protein
MTASRSWVPLAVARWCARHGGCALVITRSSPGHVDDQLGGTAVDHPQQLFADLAGIAVAHVLRKSQDRALHPGQHRRYRPARRACFHQDNRGRLSTATESCATPARPELLQLHLQHHRIDDLGHVERHETQQRQRSKGRFL